MFFTGCEHFKEGLIHTLKSLLLPEVFFPFVFIIVCLLPPSLLTLFRYVLKGQGGWSVELLAFNNFCSGIIYSFLLLWFVNKIKGVAFHKLVTWGTILQGGSYLCFFLILFPAMVPKWFLFVYRIFFTIINNLGSDLLLIPMIGRISKHLPEGFESTGITIVISFVNLGSSLNQMFSGIEQKRFGIHNGYYERTRGAHLLNSLLQILLILAAPFFLYRG